MSDQLVYAMYQVGELRSRISGKTALIDQEMPAIVQTLANAIEAIAYAYHGHDLAIRLAELKASERKW